MDERLDDHPTEIANDPDGTDAVVEDIDVDRPLTPAEAISSVDRRRLRAKVDASSFRVPSGIEVPESIPDTKFFDPLDTSEEPTIRLTRHVEPLPEIDEPNVVLRFLARVGRALGEDTKEEFSLDRRIAYCDKGERVIIVPADPDTFRSDLTSVPRFFTWLIPRTGVHLPAALIHDGLVHGEDEPPTYISNERIGREEADRIFRDGMRDLGASFVRRWLVWTAVVTATLVSGTTKWRWRGIVAGSGALIVVLGVLASFDAVDYGAPLPWMGDRPAWQEVMLGLSVAVGASALVAQLWVRRARAGFIFCTALALLLHVTAAVTFVFALIGIVESLVERRPKRAFAYVGIITVVVLPVLITWLGLRPG